GEVLFRVDPRKGKDATRISELVCAWAAIAKKYHAGEISRDEYDKWRYNYPQYDKASGYVKVLSKELNDTMTKAFKDRVKND
ncbi:MAG: hypothetical protein SOR87_04455, partial [Vescimonas coprocola]|nr:hypothetical protein [Vescimonas coprocola]